MKKRILLMLCLMLCILGITACGSDPKKVDYNGYTYEQLETGATNTWMLLESMDEATKEQYLSGGDELTVSLIENWDSIRPELGEYKETKGFNILKSGKTLTTELTLEYESRPIVITCVYTYRTMTPEAITVDMVYSTGEKMQKAALNTLMGMGTVFVMLIVICWLISGFRIISKVENKLKQKKQTQDSQVQEPAFAEQTEVKAEDDFELTAVITAAIAAAAADAGQCTDNFVVRSIKRR